MAQITLQNVSVGYGGHPVLEQVDLSIEKGQRLCLVGRNGSGKSTLLKLIADDLQAEHGQVFRQQGLRIARLIQQVPAGIQGCVYQVAAGGLGQAGELLGRDYYLNHFADLHDPAILDELADLHHRMDDQNAWSGQSVVDETLSVMQLDPQADFQALSSGMKRRVMLARCLVQRPDVLILDEPTNHLDIQTILWIEDFIAGLQTTLLLVSHDRAFVRKIARGVIDIDRGRVTMYHCDLDTYLTRKEQDIEEEERRNKLFDKRLAQEEVWIRQGVKERRTRNEGRVRRLKAMREERSQRKDQIGQVRIEVQQAQVTGRKVIEMRHVSFGYQNESGPLIVSDFSTDILRGDRIGIIGPNGSGKTTLIKLMLDELAPLSGTVRHGTNLQIAYFDQLHAALDDDKSVQENIAPGSDKVVVNDRPRHVIGYLEDFLFSPKQVRNPAGELSGGERNRLLLAKLFTRPANILVLDEPTNDLDVETLELLEEVLCDYSGTVLMVSHDRDFLNNVVTSTIALEGDGLVKEYGGGWDDYLIQSKKNQPDPASDSAKVTRPKSEKDTTIRRDGTAKPRKLSWNENKELQQLPDRIEQLENEIEALHIEMAGPDFYKKPPEAITALTDRNRQLESDLQTAYQRWEELETIKQASE